MDQIHKWIHTISTKDLAETGLFWSYDSKRLAFFASTRRKTGTYIIDLFGERMTPKLPTVKTGQNTKWLKTGDQIVWLSKGKPSQISSVGKEKKFLLLSS